MEGRKGTIRLTEDIRLYKRTYPRPPSPSRGDGLAEARGSCDKCVTQQSCHVPFHGVLQHTRVKQRPEIKRLSLVAIALSSVSHSFRRRSRQSRSSGRRMRTRRMRKDMGDYPCKDGTVKLPFITWPQWAIRGIYFILKAPCFATTSANNMLKDVSHAWSDLIWSVLPEVFTLWKELQSTQSSHLQTEGQLLSESHRRTEQNQILCHLCVVNCTENLFSATLAQVCKNGTTSVTPFSCCF